ncbi:MAG: hypothetical protein AAB537_02290 [Patescibacteria group bacterium]
MEIEKKFPIAAIVGISVSVGLVFGAVGGYYFGVTKGVASGRQAYLDEQAAVEAKKLEELSKQANPFSAAKDAANPFKDMYQNPFAQ